MEREDAKPVRAVEGYLPAGPDEYRTTVQVNGIKKLDMEGRIPLLPASLPSSHPLGGGGLSFHTLLPSGRIPYVRGRR